NATRAAATGTPRACAEATATPATRRSGWSRRQAWGSPANKWLRQWGQRTAAAWISSAQYGQVRVPSIGSPSLCLVVRGKPAAGSPAFLPTAPPRQVDVCRSAPIVLPDDEAAPSPTQRQARPGRLAP